MDASIKSVQDAKDFISRAKSSNDEIRKILERWGKEFK